MLEKIKTIVCNCVPVETDEITTDSRFIADLGFSSLDLVMFSIEVEKTFGIKIHNRLYVTVKTVGELMDYIEKNKNRM